MKTRWLVWLLCLSASSLYAQEDKQLAEIKSSNDYLFAENISDSWSDAEDAAKKILINSTMQLMADHKLPIDPVAIENTVLNAEIIELVSDNKAHICCYIHKKELIPDYKSGSAPVRKAPVDIPVQREEPAAATTTTTESTAQPFVVAESQPVQLVATDPVSEFMEIATTPITITVPDTTPPEPNRSTDEAPDYYTDGGTILDQIIQTSKTTELNQLLARLQDQRVITVGRISTMYAPDKSYVIIYNETNRVAVLDKGLDKRKNLLTGQADDSVSNYKGMRALWFQIITK